ncbi:hypothetical protein [Deinococcus sp. UYEF24]
MNLNAITAQLRLFALQAVAQTETIGVSVALQQLPTLLSQEKKDQAVEIVYGLYRSFEVNIPVLNATEIDDVLVKAGAAQAVDWAFDQLKDQLNALAPVAAQPPVTDAPELPSGEGLK